MRILYSRDWGASFNDASGTVKLTAKDALIA
jgi:hypothetical protein